MKLDQLRKIIREEVRSAVREELQDVMNEAVRVASQPGVQKLAENKPIKVAPQVPTPTNPQGGKKSIEEMLQMTKGNMTNEEYKNVFSGTSNMVSGMPNTASNMLNKMSAGAGRQPGIDISNLDFVKKAGEVLNASNQKDKEKAVTL